MISILCSSRTVSLWKLSFLLYFWHKSIYSIDWHFRHVSGTASVTQQHSKCIIADTLPVSPTILTLTSMVLTNMLIGCSKCRLLSCKDLICRQVHIVCHIHVAQIATAAAEACVVAYVGMIQRWPSNTSLLRYTVFVVWVVPTACTTSNQ